MPKERDSDPFRGELYLAGEWVSPGKYRRVEGGQIIRLDHEDYLPASLDGHVSCYARIQSTWEEIEHGTEMKIVFARGR